jgi:hypothetical protein
MQPMQFTVQIQASKEKAWQTMWDGQSFRDWGSFIDEGQYMVGELKEGSEVQFISGNGYGVTSLVEKLVPNELVTFRQMADTQDAGENLREKEWTGGSESWSLTQDGDITTLTVSLDVPEGLEEIFQENMPKALNRIKELAQ